MPSTKKRINLTVPDSVYELLQVYKEQNGLSNDATACLQLIVQQLKAQEESRLMKQIMQRFSADQLLRLSKEGYDYYKEVMEGQDEH